jgi:hypothetical protein
VKRQTDDLVRSAATRDPYCLLYVRREPDTDLLWEILEADPYNLQFVLAPTPAMVRHCLRRAGPDVLRYLQSDTGEIRRAVRNYNPRFEGFIRANPVVPIYVKKRIVMHGGLATPQQKKADDSIPYNEDESAATSRD